MPPPTSTPTATSTQTVPQEIIGTFRVRIDTLIYWILGVLATIISALLGVLRKHLKRQDEIQETNDKLSSAKANLSKLTLIDEIKKQGELFRELDEKVAKLKSIK